MDAACVLRCGQVMSSVRPNHPRRASTSTNSKPVTWTQAADADTGPACSVVVSLGSPKVPSEIRACHQISASVLDEGGGHLHKSLIAGDEE